MKTALSGPMIVYGDRPPGGTGSTGSNNPDKAPSVFWGGACLLDPRSQYNRTKAGALGFFGNPGYLMTADFTPATLAVANIAASQSPVAAALTLVSATGAGITVLAAATTVFPSMTVLAVNTLAIDGASGVVGFGRASAANSAQNVVSLYDPTKSLGRALRITSGGNDSGITFNVRGFDGYGFAMSENITGANAGIATGAKAWKYITSITPSAAVAGTCSVGTADIFGFPMQSLGFRYVDIFWNSLLITSATGYVAAVTTSPSTAVLGDVRGTYAVQSASDGTKTLQFYQTIQLANLSNNNGAASLFGVAQV